jgi:hypothetical protein
VFLFLLFHIGKTSILSSVESSRKWSASALDLLMKTSDCTLCEHGTQMEGDEGLTRRDSVETAKVSS